MFNKLIIMLILFIFNVSIFANQLNSETSPYLLQHKDNPVNWYAWNDKTLQKAKKENKLIFLSIGYSTCHWCHVMAKESFEDNEVAKLLNDNYISIKLDKEQFPHIDTYYQNIYKLLNNKSGGWPLTIILTSDMKPYFAATYIPKYSGYGSKGLMNILNDIKDTPSNKLQLKANAILNIVSNTLNTKQKIVKIDTKLEDKIFKQYQSYFDYKSKGFSIEPKFPHASNLNLLLKIYEINKNKDVLTMITSTLNAMANGGIYDQIDGAFYRYTVDKKWELPHFEKMLYTNAELIEVYAKAYKITSNPLYKRVVQETIKEIDKRFKKDEVYQSASNADSKNFQGHSEEGFFFMYEYDLIEEYLEKYNINALEISQALEYFGILKDGNFDGDYSNTNIKNTNAPKNINKIKKLLSDYRIPKEYPFIDNKINTAWNSLYIKGKLKASSISTIYAKEALISLDNLLELMYIDGVLYHQTTKGIKPTQAGLLEDYSFMASALFEAYQVSLDKKYFILFEKLVQDSIKLFYKDNRWIESQDGFKTYASISGAGYASALGVHIQNIINYATVEAKTKYFSIVRRTIDDFSVLINKYPSYHPQASIATLSLKYEPVFIKSNKSNIKNIDISGVDYPFVYRYEQSDTKLYLGCKMNSCFSFSSNFIEVKKVVEDLL